ncbi:MAG: HD family phosphohydrolase [Bacillota bacterium]
MNKFLDKIKKYFNKLKESKISPVNLSSDTRKLVIGIIFCLGIIFILTGHLIPVTGQYRIGEESPLTIRAPQSAVVIDSEETEKRRELARTGIEPVYETNRSAYSDTMEQLNQIFNVIRNFDPETEDIADLNYELNFLNHNFSQEELSLMVDFSSDELDRLEEVSEEILRDIYNGRVASDQLDQVYDEIEERLIDTDISGDVRELLLGLIEPALVPNLIYDDMATEELKNELSNQVEPITREIAAGEVIINKGEEFTAEDIEFLDQFGLNKSDLSWFQITGTALYFIIVTLVMVYYIRVYHSDIWAENKKINLIQILLLILFILSKILTVFDLKILMYLAPAAMVPILLSVLLNSSIAVAVTFYITLLLPLVFGGEFSIAALVFVGSMVGIFSVENLSQRNDLVRAGFNVSAALIVTLVMFSFIEPAYSALDTLIIMAIGLLNGILVAIFANGLLPYLESLFGLTSSVKLLELSNPSQPLLRKLLVEAPGTYHHSVLVGNLAETAADNIGANSLLARVGAYYHDIGKLSRPYFFSDNQFGGENPHDNIKPNLSALIIKSHAKDGVEMAREYNLPPAIIDIIEQHHGTNLISYFYQEALKESDDSNFNESNFRYDGPKPESKEAAILMLADICEAAVRSKNFNKSNHNRIEVLIKGLIREKLIENQLDNSELTLKDLNIISDSFTRILTGIYHQRVDYPEDIEEEMEANKNGNNK